MVQTRNLTQYAEIHAANRYGKGSSSKRNLLAPWVLLRRPKSILDYGAGKNRMVDWFVAPGATVRHRFEPAIPEISTIPLPHYELITNTDVLEHLDEGEIDPVLADIRSRCDDALFLVGTSEAKTILPNGENAHSTVRPPDWWLARVRKFFPDAEIISAPPSRVLIRTWRANLVSRLLAQPLGYVLGFVRGS